MSLLKGKHTIKEIDGVRCTVVEKKIEQERVNFLTDLLKTNGFELLYIEPNWLFIQWNVKGAKSLTKNNNPSKQINNQYKSTDTYKPSGNLIYDDKSIMNMTDKFKI